MTYRIELANRLRFTMFKPRVFRDYKARYDKLGHRLEDLAKITWAVHGVCLECRCWSITGGRCLECGIDYSSGSKGFNRELEIARQISTAKQLLR